MVKNCLLHFSRICCFLLLCAAQLKEFQQKSSPASVGGERGGGGGGGGAGAKKKRKVKGPSQHDAPSSDRNSPDSVSQSPSLSIYLPACHPALVGQITTSLCA